MGKITFEEFVKTKTLPGSKGAALQVEGLLAEQKEIVEPFLRALHEKRSIPCGKTALLKWLLEFIDEHGNDFEI